MPTDNAALRMKVELGRIKRNVEEMLWNRSFISEDLQSDALDVKAMCNL